MSERWGGVEVEEEYPEGIRLVFSNGLVVNLLIRSRDLPADN
jgi:hypothetical protein